MGIDRKVIDKVDDLEAAATYKGALYIVSSHSLNKKSERKPERELILEIKQFEVLPDGAVAYVERAATLIKYIEQALDKVKSERNGSLILDEGKFNIEGLAIDAKGYAYIGLRNPLLQIGNQGYAIVLHMPIESIFSESLESKIPETRIIALRLEDSGKDYGITSLEYDKETQAVLVLGNSPKKEEFFPPKLWVWHPNGHHAQTPTLVRNWSLRIPEKFHAKPEALVLHAGQGFIFIDALGHGGQRVFRRGELGL